MKSVRIIFKVAKLTYLVGAAYLCFNYCEWYIATFISMMNILAVLMQKEEATSDWMDYINEEG